MAFTTKEFPNKVFESMNEYNAYLELRKKIIARLKSKASEIKPRMVKVSGTIRQKDPLVQALLWILQSRRT